MIDAYAVLGVDSTAPDEEIHRAYKELSRKYHPDHGGNPDDMARLNEAYALVKTPELRRKYVNESEFSVKFKWMESVFGKSDVAGNFGKPPVDDRCGKRGSDIEITVNVPMETFIFGRAGFDITYEKTKECLQCSGRGFEKTVNCPRCGATGKIVFRKKTKECPKCNGTGYQGVGECPVCHGEKAFTRECRQTVDLAPGTTVLKLEGRGNEGIGGGPNGDLVVDFNPLFDEERGIDAFMSPDGFPFVSFSRRIHPEDFMLGTTLDFDVYGRLLVVTVPPDTVDFSYGYPVDDLFGTGLKAIVNVELAPEEPGGLLKDAYLALRKARSGKMD